MIQSMTGYGQGSSGSGAKKITASVKAVNGRYLDVKIRGIDTVSYTHLTLPTTPYV